MMKSLLQSPAEESGKIRIGAEIIQINQQNVVCDSLASYPGSWWAERKRAWYLLLAHACNYPLLNTCLAKSGRGTRILIHVIIKYTCTVECSEEPPTESLGTRLVIVKRQACFAPGLLTPVPVAFRRQAAVMFYLRPSHPST